jgi:hypothetical protein
MTGELGAQDPAEVVHGQAKDAAEFWKTESRAAGGAAGRARPG